MQELKIRLENRSALERRLAKLGAELTDITPFVDTYLRQPDGIVLKIVEKKDGMFLNQFVSNNGRFDVMQDKVSSPADLKALTQEYGVKRVMTGKRSFYKLNDVTLTINSIDSIGDFLIVTAIDPQPDFLTDVLLMDSPSYITTSFDEL